MPELPGGPRSGQPAAILPQARPRPVPRSTATKPAYARFKPAGELSDDIVLGRFSGVPNNMHFRNWVVLSVTSRKDKADIGTILFLSTSVIYPFAVISRDM